MKNNDIINYLKSIDVKTTNKHIERDLDNYLLSVVLIDTLSDTNISSERVFDVSMICFENKTNRLCFDIEKRIFEDSIIANDYFNSLVEKMNSYTADDVRKLLSK